MSSQKSINSLLDSYEPNYQQPPVEPYSEVLEERNALRQQNQQLWRIIEKQRLIIHQLQKYKNSASATKSKSNGEKTHYPVLSRATQSSATLPNKGKSVFDEPRIKVNEENEIAVSLQQNLTSSKNENNSKNKGYEAQPNTDILVEQDYKTAQRAQSIISSKYNQPITFHPTVAENVYHTNPEASEAFKILKEANLKKLKEEEIGEGFNKLRKAPSESTIRKSGTSEKNPNEIVDRKLSLNGIEKAGHNSTNDKPYEVTQGILVPKRSSRRIKLEGLENLKEDTMLSPISEKANYSSITTPKIPDLRKGVKKEVVSSPRDFDERGDILGPIKSNSSSLNSGSKLSRYSIQKATFNRPQRSSPDISDTHSDFNEAKRAGHEPKLSSSAPTIALPSIPSISPEATSPTYSEPNEPSLTLPPLPVETSRLIASRTSSIVNDSSSVRSFSSNGSNSLHRSDSNTRPINIPNPSSANHSRMNSELSELGEVQENTFFFPRPPSMDPPPHVRQSNSTIEENLSDDDELVQVGYLATKLSEGADSLANTSMVVNHGSFLPPPRSPTQPRLSKYSSSEKSSVSVSQVSLQFSESNNLSREVKDKPILPVDNLKKPPTLNLRVSASSATTPSEEDFSSRVHFLKYQYSKLEIVSVNLLQPLPVDFSTIFNLVLVGSPNPNIMSPFPHSIVHLKKEPVKNEVWRLEKSLSQIIAFDEKMKSTLSRNMWPSLTPLSEKNPLDLTTDAIRVYFSQLPLVENLDATVTDTVTKEGSSMVNYAQLFVRFLASNLAAPPLPPPQDNLVASSPPPPPPVDAGCVVSPLPQDSSILPLKKKFFKAGNLLKRGKKLGKLKLRYFVVNGPSLEYFESKDGFYLGSINLTNAQVIRSMVASLHSDLYEKYVYAITVMEPKKSTLHKHTFFLDSHQDWDQWIESLDFFSKFANQRPRGDSVIDSHPQNLTKFNQNANLMRPDKERPKLVINTKTHEQIHPNISTPDINYSVLSPAEPRPNPNSLYSNHTHTGSNNSLGNPSPSSALNPHVLPLPNDASSLSTSLPKNDNPIKNKMMEFMDGKKQSKKDSNDKERPTKAGVGVRKTFHWNTKNFFADAFKKQNTGQNRVFGVPLHQAIQQAPIKAGYHLPTVVYRCIEYMEYHKAYIEEGIYRLSGSAADIQHLKEKFDSDGDYNLLKSGRRYDVHTVAGLLKLYLREMPNYVLTQELQPEFVRVSEISERHQRVNELGRLVCALPLVNYTLLRTLTAHLIRIVERCDVNKMTLRNIGIVFVPTLAIPAGVFSLMVVEFDYVFWTNEQGSAAPKTMVNEEVATDSGAPTDAPSSTQPSPAIVNPVLVKSPTLRLMDSPQLKENSWRDSRNSVIYKDVVPQDLVTVEHPLDTTNGSIDLNLDPNDLEISDDEDLEELSYPPRNFSDEELPGSDRASPDSEVMEVPILFDAVLPPPPSNDIQTDHEDADKQTGTVATPYEFEDDEILESGSKYSTVI